MTKPKRASRQWTSSVRQDQSRKKLDRIFRAGEQVFAKQGFWNSHVDDIAHMAGVSVGSLYRRFKNKEALFFALEDELAKRSVANVEQFFSDPRCLSLSVTAVIYNLVKNGGRDLERSIGYFRALSEIGLRDEGAWDEMRKLDRKIGEALVDFVKRRGIATPPPAELIEEAAYMCRLIGAINLSVLLYGRAPFGNDAPRRFALLTRMLMRVLHVAPDEAELEELVRRDGEKSQ